LPQAKPDDQNINIIKRREVLNILRGFIADVNHWYVNVKQPLRVSIAPGNA